MRGSAEGWARRPLGARGSRSPAPAGVGRRGEAVLKRRGSRSRNIFPREILQRSAPSRSAWGLLSCCPRLPLGSARCLSAPAAARPLRSPRRGNVPWAQPLGLVPGAPALPPRPSGCGSAYPALAAALRSPLGPHHISASFHGP